MSYTHYAPVDSKSWNVKRNGKKIATISRAAHGCTVTPQTPETLKALKGFSGFLRFVETKQKTA